MVHTDFLTYTDKFIVMLGSPALADGRDAEEWYLKEHTARVLEDKKVRRYIANVSNKAYDETIAKIFDASFAKTGGMANPWASIAFVDEIYAPEWTEISYLYNDLPVLGVFGVTEYHVRQLITDRPLGTKDPEIKRICIVTKPDFMSHDEAVSYQILEHPAKCFVHHSGMACYTQNHVNDYVVPGPSTVDNFTILHFWNLDAIRFGMFSQPDSRRVISEDCNHFRSTTWPIHVDQYIMKAN
ncbi:hypothetical protein [uncultured Mailhella sp.]|uniref:hypothetical protein n=1 Tax=uncultured Mailhella sp. TaxID=1981031 RepID=UPI0025EBA428|nr:hypothetical protein [uncultured Mailhella sp.]